MGAGEDRGGTIKRVSLVRLRKDISRHACFERWAGEHADVVRALPGILQYTVDLSRDMNRPADSWDAVATLRFEDDAALRRFHDPAVQEQLLATRADFALAADVFLVDERQLIRSGGSA